MNSVFPSWNTPTIQHDTTLYISCLKTTKPNVQGRDRDGRRTSKYEWKVDSVLKPMVPVYPNRFSRPSGSLENPRTCIGHTSFLPVILDAKVIFAVSRALGCTSNLVWCEAQLNKYCRECGSVLFRFKFPVVCVRAQLTRHEVKDDGLAY